MSAIKCFREPQRTLQRGAAALSICQPIPAPPPTASPSRGIALKYLAPRIGPRTLAKTSWSASRCALDERFRGSVPLRWEPGKKDSDISNGHDGGHDGVDL